MHQVRNRAELATRGSSGITVSWSYFRHRAKTSLVGGIDNHADDEGRLKVTFHHNLWLQAMERSPRVRYGQVHLPNNLYRIDDVSRHGYSIGVGHRADILSQANAWPIAARLWRRLGADSLRDQDSLLNGGLASLPDDAPPPATAPMPWQPPYALRIDLAADVAARVSAGAGAGRLWTGVPPPRTRP